MALCMDGFRCDSTCVSCYKIYNSKSKPTQDKTIKELATEAVINRALLGAGKYYQELGRYFKGRRDQSAIECFNAFKYFLSTIKEAK